MKTPLRFHRIFSRRAAMTAAFLAGLSPIPASRAHAGPATADAKDHVLFVGTDLDVKEDGKFYHVVGATKDALKIDKEHRVADVTLGRGANLRVSKGVKLSNLSAKISDVHTESVDRASARAQLEAMQTSLALGEEARLDVDRSFGPVSYLSGTGVDMEKAPTSYANLQTIKQGAFDNYENKLLGINGLNDSSNSYLIHKLAESGQTEVEMSFNVSSPVPIEHPYMIVIATYAVDDKPDQIARQVSARTFDHIDGHTQHVTMSHAASLNGLPFKKFDVALFANGEEVATNLSEKQTPLTTDQAYQFFLIDYLSSHRGETLPPAPMLMTPRAEFRRQVANADLNRAVYATVEKSGKVVAMSADAAGREKLPAEIASALQSVRFMPALDRGEPVDGRIAVTLAQLAK